MIDTRINRLRDLLKREGLDGWYINGTDPHQSEYVCSRWRGREWITGFTGSAGQVIITADKALLWVDSRYYVQAASQIKGSCITLMKLGWEDTPTPYQWLKSNFDSKSRLGFDGATVSVSSLESLKKETSLTPVPLSDLLDEIWSDRPQVPSTPLISLSDEIAGKSRAEKIADIRSCLKSAGADFTIISSVDDIAWITNMRASDIPHNPVFLSYLVIGMEKVWLFTSPERFSEKLKAECGDLEILPYDAVLDTVRSVIPPSATVYLDPERTNLLIRKEVEKAVYGRDFSTDMKAVKNAAELEGMRESHVKDGVAMVNFFATLDFEHPDYNEYQLSQMLREQRMSNPDCLDESFTPIAGFGPNGAMCHYAATETEFSPVKGNGLLVLDTGGIYTRGMTDITRTLLFGEPTDEERRDYTLVLKGHLAIGRAVFIKGTCGYHLDILAKQYLWQHKESFFHGTGHGVGFRLNVHEGPQNISPRAKEVPMKPGMVVSNEPGVYKEGRHGIRIENLIACVDAGESEFGQFYRFETLTLCPYERRLIDLSLLSEEEIDEIDRYHKRVYDSLIGLVDQKSVKYLTQATRPLREER